MVRVGVVGAGGRMGAEVCRAIADAEGLELVAAIDPGRAGATLRDVTGIDTDLTVLAELEGLTTAEVEVAVDFTAPAVAAANTAWLLAHGIHAVIGTTGITADQLQALREAASTGPANALIAPNFAIGAVLLMQFAAAAARHMPDVEIIELHHDGKVDAPSGTALRTADLIADNRTREVSPVGGDAPPGARGHVHRGVVIHSVRLPGLVAHQEVLFGGLGQTLSIRHDSLDRTSFMPGVLLAVRRVGQLDGLVVGLESLLG